MSKLEDFTNIRSGATSLITYYIQGSMYGMKDIVHNI
jgi:hypothetical protein